MESKRKFLIDQIIKNCTNAAFQRANVYVKGLKENDKGRENLRNSLKEKLLSMDEQYKENVTDAEHCTNIVNLANDLTSECKDSLRDNRFRIGIAQKVLNLYLKYKWCLVEIPMPPHCPLDGRIINKRGLKGQELDNCNWTEFDDIEIYKFLIEKCKDISKKNGKESIAEWELEEWA
jgi:hypothetical protein